MMFLYIPPPKLVTRREFGEKLSVYQVTRPFLYTSGLQGWKGKLHLQDYKINKTNKIQQ